MGFFRNRQIEIVTRLLKWRYEQNKIEVPEQRELLRQATAIVDQAKEIARRTGKNILVIARQLMNKSQ